MDAPLLADGTKDKRPRSSSTAGNQQSCLDLKAGLVAGLVAGLMGWLTTGGWKTALLAGLGASLFFGLRLFQCTWLKSGEVDQTKQDSFKHSPKEFAEFLHDTRGNSQSGTPVPKIIDELLALLTFAGPLLWTIGSTASALVTFMGHMWRANLDSMALIMFANTIIELVIVLGAFLMWMTVCYWIDKVHSFWKVKVWPLPSLMPGGFMPRMAAFSLGVLMFTTTTMVTEGRVKGKDLAKKFHDDHWQYCRATDMAAEGAPWYGRILTRPTVVDGGYHCFNAEFRTAMGHNISVAKVMPFSSTAVQPFFDHIGDDFTLNTDAFDSGLDQPAVAGRHMSQSVGFPMDKLVAWHLLDADRLPHYTFQCMYQCSKWKTVGLMAVIKNAGTIVAGSAVVVKTSDSISKRFGGYFLKSCFGHKCMMGLPLIAPDTLPATISEVTRKTLYLPGKGRSKFVAAFICLSATIPLRFASKIDANGYYTVDYYVTAVFFSSLVMALVMRQFNPYKMTRIAYTEDLWVNGEDTFIDFKNHSHRKINLYEWIHLNQQARADHLLGYARLLTKKDIDNELGNQKNFEKLEKDLGSEVVHVLVKAYTDKAREEDAKAAKTKPDEVFDEENKMPELTEEQRKAKMDELADLKAKLAGADKNVLDLPKSQVHVALVSQSMTTSDNENPYCNRYANLVVKTIKEIPVVKSSRPLKKEWAAKTNYGEGITILKTFKLLQGSVGTVVEKLDGDRIKVRFPRVVPENAPTHKSRNNLPQYTIEWEPPLDHISLDHSRGICDWIRDGLDYTHDKNAPKKRYDVEFEDVEVSLEQIFEASQQWVDIQDQRDQINIKYKKEEKAIEAEEAAEIAAESAEAAEAAKKAAEAAKATTEGAEAAKQADKAAAEAAKEAEKAAEAAKEATEAAEAAKKKEKAEAAKKKEKATPA